MTKTRCILALLAITAAAGTALAQSAKADAARRRAETHDVDPAATRPSTAPDDQLVADRTAWYAELLKAGTPLPLSTPAYRPVLTAHLATLTPEARHAWFADAIKLIDNRKAFAELAAKVRKLQPAAGWRMGDAFRSGTNGPTQPSGAAAAWEAIVNLADDPAQRELARERWQAEADRVYDQAVSDWERKAGQGASIGKPQHATLPTWGLTLRATTAPAH